MKRYIATLLLLAICASTQAREVFPLNEGWRFFFKSENSSDNARHVTLPHTWNTDTGGTGYFLETTANYQNDMYIPAEWATKRLFVKFYGVQSVADVFVNGYYVGGHKGGGTAFALEITDKIRFGSDNALLVVVSNNYCDDVLPTSTDMNLYGGIYREAELILTEKTAVSPLYLGSDGILVRQNSVSDERVEGEAEIHLVTGGENSCVLTLDITAPDGSRVFSKRQKTRIDGKPVTIPFSVDAPQLWSPANPALYRVSVSIGDATVTDSVAVRTGFRSIVATPAGGFAVNGSRIPIHGVTLYHDNAISGGALIAPDYEADLGHIRTLGANALRSAVMPHAQYLYDRCDELGMLVWVDAPFHRSSFLGDVAYYATPAVRTERPATVAGDHCPKLQPPLGGDVGYLFAALDARQRRNALPGQAQRGGTRPRPFASHGGLQRPGRQYQLHHRPDRLATGRRLAQRHDGRRDRMARPVAERVVTPPLGNLLRGQRLHRTQKLYGTGGTPRELDARGASDSLPRAVCQKPPERLAFLGDMDQQHVRLRFGTPALRGERRRSRDHRPPRAQGCVLPL